MERSERRLSGYEACNFELKAYFFAPFHDWRRDNDNLCSFYVYISLHHDDVPSRGNKVVAFSFNIYQCSLLL